ncbi:MAG TPA: acyl-CoA dehydrogenase family protein [Microthrixaceae bacterium]|jgi:alkylation response protein AidB-like acyl-CoA dehydrogenase|nr:acyl-CoA dehydrogenase family protein [Microthrixaceae bacterium]
MDLLPTPEQEEIVTTVRAQLDKQFGLNALAARDGADQVVSRELWRRCAELGWFGLGLEESLGGVGYTVVEEALLFAELGSHATPGPFLATVLSARLAATEGDAALAASILSGDVLVALAEAESSGATVGAAVSGRFRVTDHGGADLFLAVGADPTAGMAIIDAVAATPEPSLDLQVPLGVVDLDSTAARVFVGDSSALWLRATVLLASQLAGSASATAAQSVEYAKDREQFGKPIGSFQAVKHRCADMAVLADAATSLSRYASLAVANGRPDGAFHAQAAWTIAARAAVTNAHVNVQNHGGIGFTWEHTAHRYVTRSQFLVRTLGNRAEHLDALLAEPAPS